MAPKESIATKRREALPADFSEWDSGDIPATLPDDFSDFDAAAGSGTPAKPLTQAAAWTAADRPANTNSPTPPTGYKDLSQPIQSSGVNTRDLKIESKGKRRTMVTVVAIGSMLLLLILIPLIYSKLLPKSTMQKQSVVPQTQSSPQVPKPSPQTQSSPQTHSSPQMPKPSPETTTAAVPPPRVQTVTMDNQLTAPTRITQSTKRATEQGAPPAPGFGVSGIAGLGGSSDGVIGSVFGGRGAPAVKAAPPTKMTVSAGVAAGLLLQKTAPNYPGIAKAARVSGTVVLQATISKTGSIEGLRIVSGPLMLHQAALDAVKTWRYRPYLLNNQPVEVLTTVNVVFILGS